VPLLPFVTFTQLRFSIACHPQPICVVTETVKEPPAAGTACVVGLSVAVQLTCVTVKVWPAIVNVPERLDPCVTLYVTVPLPLPELPLVICSHPAFDVAVHEQPLAAVTATVKPSMSSSPTVIEVGLMDGAQAGADWLIVNVAPLTVTIADLAVPEFAAAVKPTEPLPTPLAVERVTHVACLVAVH
jgi:hypothetical protein